MKLETIKEILHAEIVVGEDDLQKEVKMACGCDLMSDVLAFIKSDSILLTGLVNPQCVRTAEVSDVTAICFVRGKKPPEETIALAKEKNIVLLATEFLLYESCGELYKAGLPGCSEYGEEV
jgi:predicted transcriptional regulator